MTSPLRSRTAKHSIPYLARTKTFLPAALLTCGVAHAQQVLVPPTEFSERTPSVDQASSNWIGSATSAPLGPAADPSGTPLVWGPVRFRPHLGYQVVYGDGVLRDANDPQITVLHTITPGMLMNVGRNWEVDLTASIDRYSKGGFNDSIGYSIGVNGRIPFEQFPVNISYRGNRTEQPQVETGTQSRQDSHRLGLSGNHAFNEQLSLEVNLIQDVQATSGFSDYWSWSTLEWLNYKVSTRTTLGLGAGFGYNWVKPGTDSLFEQLQGRVVWLPGSKLSLQLSAGLQVQHFFQEADGLFTEWTGSTNVVDIVPTDDDTETGLFPLFQASAVYELFAPTTLSVDASHQIGNSSLQDVFTQTTSVGGGLRQRLFKSVFLNVRPSYTFMEYRTTGAQLKSRRDDEYFTLYAGLSTQFFKKLDATIFYQFSDNSSSLEAFTFDSTQVGLQLNYRY